MSVQVLPFQFGGPVVAIATAINVQGRKARYVEDLTDWLSPESGLGFGMPRASRNQQRNEGRSRVELVRLEGCVREAAQLEWEGETWEYSSSFPSGIVAVSPRQLSDVILASVRPGVLNMTIEGSSRDWSCKISRQQFAVCGVVMFSWRWMVKFAKSDQ